jgi:hypothetical protein
MNNSKIILDCVLKLSTEFNLSIEEIYTILITNNQMEQGDDVSDILSSIYIKYMSGSKKFTDEEVRVIQSFVDFIKNRNELSIEIYENTSVKMDDFMRTVRVPGEDERGGMSVEDYIKANARFEYTYINRSDIWNISAIKPMAYYEPKRFGRLKFKSSELNSLSESIFLKLMNRSLTTMIFCKTDEGEAILDLYPQYRNRVFISPFPKRIDHLYIFDSVYSARALDSIFEERVDMVGILFEEFSTSCGDPDNYILNIKELYSSTPENLTYVLLLLENISRTRNSKLDSVIKVLFGDNTPLNSNPKQNLRL